MYSSFFSWSWVRVPSAGPGTQKTTGDATQEDIVLGILLMVVVDASHAPQDTIVQAGLIIMAIEN